MGRVAVLLTLCVALCAATGKESAANVSPNPAAGEIDMTSTTEDVLGIIRQDNGLTDKEEIPDDLNAINWREDGSIAKAESLVKSADRMLREEAERRRKFRTKMMKLLQSDLPEVQDTSDLEDEERKINASSKEATNPPVEDVLHTAQRFALFVPMMHALLAAHPFSMFPSPLMLAPPRRSEPQVERESSGEAVEDADDSGEKVVVMRRISFGGLLGRAFPPRDAMTMQLTIIPKDAPLSEPPSHDHSVFDVVKGLSDKATSVEALLEHSLDTHVVSKGENSEASEIPASNSRISSPQKLLLDLPENPELPTKEKSSVPKETTDDVTRRKRSLDQDIGEPNPKLYNSEVPERRKGDGRKHFDKDSPGDRRRAEWNPSLVSSAIHLNPYQYKRIMSNNMDFTNHNLNNLKNYKAIPLWSRAAANPSYQKLAFHLKTYPKMAMTPQIPTYISSTRDQSHVDMGNTAQMQVERKQGGVRTVPAPAPAPAPPLAQQGAPGRGAVQHGAQGARGAQRGAQDLGGAPCGDLCLMRGKRSVANTHALDHWSAYDTPAKMAAHVAFKNDASWQHETSTAYQDPALGRVRVLRKRLLPQEAVDWTKDDWSHGKDLAFVTPLNKNARNYLNSADSLEEAKDTDQEVVIPVKEVLFRDILSKLGLNIEKSQTNPESDGEEEDIDNADGHSRQRRSTEDGERVPRHRHRNHGAKSRRKSKTRRMEKQENADSKEKMDEVRKRMVVKALEDSLTEQRMPDEPMETEEGAGDKALEVNMDEARAMMEEHKWLEGQRESEEQMAAGQMQRGTPLSHLRRGGMRLPFLDPTMMEDGHENHVHTLLLGNDFPLNGL